MARRDVAVLIVALACLDAMTAAAETRGTLRAGVMALDLTSSRETPLFGEQVDRAVDRYNTAVAAFDQATGTMTERIDASDLGVTETLLMVAPGLEFGGRHYFFRIEAPIGLSDDLKSFGLGLYPLNLEARLGRRLAAYVSAGGTASWLDRPGPGDVGGLVTLRGAVGMRLARRMLIEVGYGAFALGGTVNKQRLESMALTVEDMRHPDKLLSAGEARGLVDVSIGLSF